MRYKTFYTILLFLTTCISYTNAQALNCQGLPAISCGSVVNGTNANNTNKFTTGSYNCLNTNSNFNAPDVVYSLKIEVPGTYEFTLSGLNADLDLFMMKDLCTEVPNCILKSSNSGVLSEKIGPLGFEAGQYYFIIDGYNASQISNFTFKVSCDNGCSGIDELVCGQIYTKSTLNTTNKLTRSDYNGFVQSSNNFDGNDILFKYHHNEYNRNANVVIWGFTGDLDMFLLKNCNRPFDCVKSAKNLNENYEYIDFTGLPYGDYYIAVDGFNSAQKSQFKLLVSCQYICAFEGITENIECGQTKSGTTVNSINAFSKYSCFSEYQFTGPERYYFFKAPADGEYIIDLTGFSNDLELFVLDIANCIYNPVCQYKSINPPGLAEQIKLPLKKDQSITMVVDGALGAAGAYQLKITCPSTSNRCLSIPSIICDQEISATNVNGGNDFSITDYSCHQTLNAFNGQDRLYQINVALPKTVEITLTDLSADLDIFLLDGICLNGTPVTGKCITKSTNQGSNNEKIGPVLLEAGKTYYISVDGYDQNQLSKFKLKLTCVNTSAPKCMDCFQCFRWKKGGGENEVYFENSFCEEDYIGLNEAGGFRGAVTYDWDFAGENVSFLDGTNKSSQNPKCKFPRTGKFKVCFKVYQLGNLIFECCRTVYVNPCQSGPVPRLNYTINESSGEVQFDASASSGAEGYDWDFGGGTSVVTHDTKPKRKYLPGKCYTVCLIVYNGFGSSKICITVCPGYAPCTSLSPNHPVANMTLTDDKLQFSNISETFWDKIEWKLPGDVEFDQGSNAASSNPRFKFKKPGSYIFCGIFYYKCHKICICWAYNYPGFAPAPKCMDCFQCFRWKKGGGENEVYFENSFCEEDYIGFNESGGRRGAVTYVWDFAGENISFLDGTNKSSQNPKCRFPREGKFKVCLKVYQLGNLIFECCRTVYISPCQTGPVPRLNYTINESSGEVQFDASASSGAEGYDWDFGGGTSVVTHDTKPKRKYPPGKCFTVCLIVYNGCGSSKICITVCPGYAPCTSLSPNHPVANMTLTDDKLQFSNISETFWDKIEWKLPADVEFDQGSTTTTANPRFKFKKPGSYIFCAIIYYKCHKICICWTYYYPGLNPSPITCDKICPFLITSYRDCHSFEEYANGSISPQKNTDPWDKFESGTDGQVVSGTSKSGSKSLNIKTGTPGTSYAINREINGIARLEWLMNIPSGGHGGWIISTDVLNYQFPFDVTYLNGTGSSKSKSLQKEELISFTYPQNQWFRTVLIFNSFDKTIELWINNKFIHKITYEVIVGNKLKVNYLTFKGGNGIAVSNFYVDDLCYSEIVMFITCEQTYDPVCVNGKTFNNDCFARAAGYSENEWIKGACITAVTCEQICPPFNTSYRDCHSFEEFTQGTISSQNNSDPWKLAEPGTDGQVTSNTPKSGSKSLNMKTKGSSTYYAINRPVNGISRLDWNMYIPAGSHGGWSVSTNAVIFRSPFYVTYSSFDADFNNVSGSLKSIAPTKEETLAFSFPVNQWFRNVLIFNSVDKTIELWINNKFINKVSYELPAGTNTLQISNLTFKDGNNGQSASDFFVDDLCYSEIIITNPCTLEIDPVCVNGKEFVNPCNAKKSGYSENEWIKGACAPSVQKLTFDIDDNVCDAKGNKIIVPVRVTNYKSIRNFSMTIQVADKGIASIINITSPVLPEMVSVEIDPGKTYAIILNSINGATLADGAIAFNIELTLTGNTGQSTALSILSVPVEIKAAALINNATTVVPVEVKNGSACIMNTSFQLSGQVKNRKNEGIQNAGVTLTGPMNISTTTNQNGQYTFTGLNNGTYTIGVKKLNNAKNGVDIFDLAVLQDHIITRSVITDPYKLLAADVNSDGEIDIFDLADLQDVIITRKQNFSGDQSWKFIPTGETLTAAKVKARSFQTTRSVDANTADKTNQDFYGIKTGDLADEAANPKDLKSTQDHLIKPVESRGAGSFALKMPSVRAKKDDIIFMPIELESFKNIRVFQFELKWNPGALRLDGVQDLLTQLNGFGINNVLYNEMTPGKLNFLWINIENQNLPDNTILGKLKFKVLANQGESTAIEFLDVKASEVQGPVSISKVTNGAVIVGDVTTRLNRSDLEYVRFNLFPIPAGDRITISSEKIFEIRQIIDLYGKQYPVNERGRSLYILDITRFSPGIYFVQTNVQGEVGYHKFIVQK